jgi:hypothetical protein
MNLFEELDSPISLIDVGTVGDLPVHWLPLAPICPSTDSDLTKRSSKP